MEKTGAYFAEVVEVLRPESGEVVAHCLVLFSVSEFVQDSTCSAREFCIFQESSVGTLSQVDVPANGNSDCVPKAGGEVGIVENGNAIIVRDSTVQRENKKVLIWCRRSGSLVDVLNVE